MVEGSLVQAPCAALFRRRAATFSSSGEVRAMAPAAREVLFELLRDSPPAIRLKIAQMICEWGIKTHL